MVGSKSLANVRREYKFERVPSHALSNMRKEAIALRII